MLSLTNEDWAMDSRLNIIKGIHPGKLIERDLKKKNFTQRFLAEKTGIPYQTINAVIMGRRKLTIGQALKIESLLQYEEGFLAMLQVHYEMKQYKDREFKKHFDKGPNIRRSLFWDADFDSINWAGNKKAVIRRVLERGNRAEIDEVRRFYHLSANDMKLSRPGKIHGNSKTQKIKD
jgi:addiction module HigA family antidote